MPHALRIRWASSLAVSTIGFIEGALSTHLINIHMSNPDSNNHSSNENLRLQNLWDGIEQAAGLLLLDVRP